MPSEKITRETSDDELMRLARAVAQVDRAVRHFEAVRGANLPPLKDSSAAKEPQDE